MPSKTILVTGGNRSIGFGIVRQLAQRSPKNNIIIASRDKKNAEQAVTELRTMGFKAPFHPLLLDVDNDDSIKAAVAEVQDKYGVLDVLINNAGIAILESDPSSLRSDWAKVLNTNVVSVRIVSELFLPLLRRSQDPRILNISSARGSFDRVTAGKNPPTKSSAYSTSKAALNMMMLDMATNHPDITFYAVSPGHCKTAFNGFRGTKDPMEGGKAAAELALAERGRYQAGFWECEGDGMQMVGW